MNDYRATDEATMWQLAPPWANGVGEMGNGDTLLVRLRHQDQTAGLGTMLQRLALARQLTGDVAMRHAAGQLHGDLSPHAVVFVNGVARWSDGPTIAASEPPAGTPMYVAPEVAAGAAVDATAECYALTASIAHLLRLTPPFELPAEREAFWRAKREVPVPSWGDGPQLPEEVRSALLAGLLGDRSLRADAQRVLAALDAVLAHADDIALRESVRQRLDRQHAGTDQDLDGILADLAVIQANYPGDPLCPALVAEARAAQARRAVAAGNVEQVRLLTATAAPEDQPATRLLLAAATTAHHRKVTRDVGRWLLVALAVLGFGCAAMLWTTKSTVPAAAWMPLWERSFYQPDTLLAGLGKAHHSWPGLRPVEPPSAEGLLLHPEQLIWVTDTREGGDVRVTADVLWTERVDGFEILVHADDQPPPQWWMMPRSIGCQFGAGDGLVHLLSPNHSAGAPSPLTSTTSDVVPGRLYRLALELHADTVRLLIDGREILSRRVGIPIAGAGLNRIAIRAWSDMRLRHLMIERLAPRDRVSPVAIGDALLANGDPAAALTAWQHTVIDNFGRPESGIAAARGFLVSCGHPDLSPGRAWFMDRLVLDHARSPMLADCQAAEASLLWRNGRYQAALALANELLDYDPSSTVALGMLASTPRPLPALQAQQLLGLLARRPETPALDLHNLDLDDIAPLRGMRTRILNLAGNRIANLGPLAGMPLVELNLTGNPISGIAILSSASQLRRLRLGGSKVASIAALRGLPIDELDLSDTAVADLGALAGMPLRELRLEGCPVNELSALRGAPLETLNAKRCLIRDLAPLSGGKLRELYMAGNAISDLRPLAGMPIRSLDLAFNQVTDLSPLAGMPIRELVLNANRIVDISALAGMPLRDCHLADNAIADLSPLTRASDGASRSLVLDTLHLDGNPLVDVEALASVQSSVLTLVGCGLRQMPLGQHASLDLSLNPLDTAGEATIAPARLYVLGSRLGPDRLLAWASAWERQQADPALVRHLRAQAAALAGDVQALRSLAAPAGPQHLINVASQLTFAQAMQVASGLGAQLPRLPDAASEDAMASATAPMISAWLDVQHGPEGWAWQDGSRAMARPLPAAGPDAGAWLFNVVQGRRIWAATPNAQLEATRAGLVLAW